MEPIDAAGQRRWVTTGGALIVAAGNPPPAPLVGVLAERADTVLAADGGALVAEALGLTVDAVIGDLDSLPATWRAAHPDVACIHDGYEHDTDLVKALRHAAAVGHTTADVIGVDGGRSDHQLAALLALTEAPSELTAVVHLSDADVTLLDADRPVLRLDLPVGQHLSLLPLAPLPRISATGVRWPLADEPLRGTQGLHNEALGGPCELTLEAGGPVLLMLVQPTP